MSQHGSMTPEEVGRQIKVTDEAVQAALDVANDDGHNGIDCKPDRNFAVTMRAALEAAVPHLQVQAGGDDGLREAIEREIRRASTAMLCNSDIPGWTMQEEVSKAADAVLALLSPEEVS